MIINRRIGSRTLESLIVVMKIEMVVMKIVVSWFIMSRSLECGGAKSIGRLNFEMEGPDL